MAAVVWDGRYTGMSSRMVVTGDGAAVLEVDVLVGFSSAGAWWEDGGEGCDGGGSG